MTYNITKEINEQLERAEKHQKIASELLTKVCKEIKKRENKKGAN